MASLFSVVPALNRLLEIAQQEAAKRGHVIMTYDKVKERGEIIYAGECLICHCTVKVVCSAHQYKRYGTAYTTHCKPG
jgi:hypothetical protein